MQEKPEDWKDCRMAVISGLLGMTAIPGQPTLPGMTVISLSFIGVSVKRKAYFKEYAVSGTSNVTVMLHCVSFNVSASSTKANEQKRFSTEHQPTQRYSRQVRYDGRDDIRKHYRKMLNVPGKPEHTRNVCSV